MAWLGLVLRGGSVTGRWVTAVKTRARARGAGAEAILFIYIEYLLSVSRYSTVYKVTNYVLTTLSY